MALEKVNNQQVKTTLLNNQQTKSLQVQGKAGDHKMKEMVCELANIGNQQSDPAEVQSVNNIDLPESALINIEEEACSNLAQEECQLRFVPLACGCDCVNSGLVADIEGIKLDITILQSQINGRVPEVTNTRFLTEIRTLRERQHEMDNIIKQQEAIIDTLTDENLNFKSQLLSFETYFNNQGSQRSPKPQSGVEFNCNEIGLHDETSPTLDASVDVDVLNQCDVPLSVQTEKIMNSGDEDPALSALNNQQLSFSKGQTPCPFLLRKGWCAKGSHCDFSHSNLNGNYSSFSTPKHMVPCPFLGRKGSCLKGASCDFSHRFRPNLPRQRIQAHRQYNPPFLGNRWDINMLVNQMDSRLRTIEEFQTNPKQFHPLMNMNLPPLMSQPTYPPYPHLQMGLPRQVPT